MGRVPEKRMSWTEVADIRDTMEINDRKQSRKREEKVAKKRGKVTADGVYRKLVKQQFRCAISGVLLNPEDAALDHIVPLCEGGEHVIQNVQIVHKLINRMKGTMGKNEMVGWCRKVAQWNG